MIESDVFLVQLKGRENRFSEELDDGLSALAGEIADALCSAELDHIILFGHSMGATIAWMVAGAAWSVHRRQVTLVVSAQLPPPYGPRQVERTARIVRDGIATSVPGGVSDLVATQMGEAYLATLTGDLEWIARQFGTVATEPLPIDIHCISAADDDVAPTEGVVAWERLTTRRFSHRTVSGGHLYLLTSADQALDLVREIARDATSQDFASA